MQQGKNGVKGPAQNARYALATQKHHLQPSSANRRYPPQTGAYIIIITAASKRIVVLSARFAFSHSDNLLILSFVSILLLFCQSDVFNLWIVYHLLYASKYSLSFFLPGHAKIYMA